MSLSKKISRNIRVANMTFRWAISPKPTQIILVVESADMKGQKMEVIIDSDIDRFWIDFPNTSELNLKVIMPKDVELIILQALQLQWTPLEKGPILRFKFENETLKRLIGQ